jgi:pyroglutamyl-peptidase
MTKKILLTSFQTWLPHQVSNSSDDLLAILEAQPLATTSLHFLRQLPVDIELASQKAIATLQALQPDVTLCCGMAESRDRLTLESNATWGNRELYTSLDLEQLVVKLSSTYISHDAGKFVCEGLYYRVLSHLQRHHPQGHALFVHVPLLTSTNLPRILRDFQLLLEAISSSTGAKLRCI